MSRNNKRNGIPDRWLDYTAVGRRLDGTRFIAFKVPLKQSLNRQLQSSEVFGPWELLDAVKEQNQDLGLIIDLTFTTRYYQPQDVPESLQCIKIFTAGHEVPSDATILSFKRAVHQFLKDNEDNDKLIGVHCTHGLNRTGYLICRYLIDVDGMDPDKALELFNSSRGHSVERQNYLEDLQHGPKRSNDGMEELEQEPKRGGAQSRPSYTSPESDVQEERRTNLNEAWRRGLNQRSHLGLLPTPQLPRIHHLPSAPHLPPVPLLPLAPTPHFQHPNDGLLPTPHFRPPPPASFHPYRRTPPHPDRSWRRPSHSEENRSRYSPPPLEPEQDHRRRAPPPLLPRYSPRWTPEPTGRDGPEDEWNAPNMRHVRHPHNNRDRRYNPY